MKNQSCNLNSCICKCGGISCRNIHIRHLSNSNGNDHFIYSALHHESLRVKNTKSITVDKCCGNCLHFHCSKCQEQFTISKCKNSKSRFIFGFSSDCLTHLEPTKFNEIVIIPEFPIALRSFVSLSENNDNESTSNVKIPTDSNDFSFDNHENSQNDEILSYDSDEEVMFGTTQTDFIIGKYIEPSISSFGQSSSAN